MAVIRFFAWILVALALMLLGADAMSTIEMGTPMVRTTAEVLGQLGLPLAPAEGGALADVSKFVLEAPLWALLGVVGVILTLVFRPID